MPTLITIEGNIGSGKSTLLSTIRETAEFSDIILLKEPVDEWQNIKDEHGVSILELFYADPKTHSFPFQMMAYISRLVILKEAVQKNPHGIIIMERCLHTDKHVFAKMLHDTGQMTDVNYAIYLKWFDTFSKDFPINKIIYVKTTPEMCADRVKCRARDGETAISLAYLKDCHDYHEDLMDVLMYDFCSEKLVLDGNVHIPQTPAPTNGEDEDEDCENEKDKDDSDRSVRSTSQIFPGWVDKIRRFIRQGSSPATNSSSSDKYLLQFDGCSKGNPGISGSGAVIYKNDIEIASVTQFAGTYATNNHAEYLGMIIGLERAVECGIRDIAVQGDSLLVVSQMTGDYKVRSPEMMVLFSRAKKIEKMFDSISYSHVFRDDNKRADELSNIALNIHQSVSGFADVIY